MDPKKPGNSSDSRDLKCPFEVGRGPYATSSTSYPCPTCGSDVTNYAGKDGSGRDVYHATSVEINTEQKGKSKTPKLFYEIISPDSE